MRFTPFGGCVKSAKTHRRVTKSTVRPRRLDAPYTPHIEALETRTLLSTCHVTRLGDAGGGSGFRGDLRYCINKVNDNPGPDAIDFRKTGTININSALPRLASDIDIQGPGSELLTLYANTGGMFGPFFRIFYVAAGATVQISGVTMMNGHAFDKSNPTVVGSNVKGGGAVLNVGDLTLERVAVTGNRANGAYFPATGGGIHNSGTMTVSYSTVDHNLAHHEGEETDAFGGGIYNDGSMLVQHTTIADNVTDPTYNSSLGGGIYNRGSMTILNSSIVRNDADTTSFSSGGGIYNHGAGDISIFHSTIALNKAGWGGGIEGNIGEMRNTIIANNSASELHDDFSGVIVTSGHNLIGNSAGGTGYSSTDILDVDPLLGPLADNGGPTLTMALLPGSPAIDAGDNTDAPDFDQRGPGFPRIVNGTVDIGAFEVQATGAPLPAGARRGSPDPAVFISADFEDEHALLKEPIDETTLRIVASGTA